MHQSLLVPAAFLEILPNEKNMGIAVSTMLKKKKKGITLMSSTQKHWYNSCQPCFKDFLRKSKEACSMYPEHHRLQPLAYMQFLLLATPNVNKIFFKPECLCFRIRMHA